MPSAAAIDKAWDFGDPKSSEERFRHFVRRLRESKNQNLLSEAVTQLARAQGLQRKFKLAHKTLDSLVHELPVLSARSRVRYDLERGRIYNSAGRPKKALPLFLDAWRIARRHGEDRLAVDAAHMTAIVTSGAAQRAWNARALELALHSRDPAARRWRASLLNNMGWSSFDAGDYHDALRSFRRALVYRQGQRVPQETRVARWCIAKTLRLLGRPREALGMQRRLLADWRRAHGKDGYVFEELAECLLTLGRPGEARRFFRAAYVELAKDPWLVSNEASRLNRLQKLGTGRSTKASH